mgnify:CR=1 FL=1
MDEARLERLMASKHSQYIGSVQHLLPQMYMERFAGGTGVLTRIDRTTNDRRQIPITALLAQRDFYTFVEHDGSRSGQLEALLGAVEADAAEVLRQLTHPLFRQIPLTPDHRLALANFVAFQYLRGARWRRTLEVLFDVTERVVLASVNESNVDAFLSDRGVDPTAEARAEVLEWVANLDSRQFGVHPNEHIRSMAEQFQLVWPLFYWRPIRLVVFPEPCLVTCDEPIYVAPSSIEAVELGVGSGLIDASALWLPIDARHLLVFGRLRTMADAGDIVISSRDIDLNAAHVNSTTMANSHRWVLVGPDVAAPTADQMPGPASVIGVTGLEALPGLDQVLATLDPLGRLRPGDAPLESSRSDEAGLGLEGAQRRQHGSYPRVP